MAYGSSYVTTNVDDRSGVQGCEPKSRKTHLIDDNNKDLKTTNVIALNDVEEWEPKTEVITNSIDDIDKDVINKDLKITNEALNGFGKCEADAQKTEFFTTSIDEMFKDLETTNVEALSDIGQRDTDAEKTEVIDKNIVNNDLKTANVEALNAIGECNTEAQKTEFITSLIDDINKDLEKYTPTFTHKLNKQSEEATLTHSISFYRKQANARRLASKNITG